MRLYIEALGGSFSVAVQNVDLLPGVLDVDELGVQHDLLHILRAVHVYLSYFYQFLCFY